MTMLNNDSITVEQLFSEIETKLLTLPDATGLSKCAGFYLMFQAIELLKHKYIENTNQYNDEKNALLKKITELETRLMDRKEDQNDGE